MSRIRSFLVLAVLALAALIGTEWRAPIDARVPATVRPVRLDAMAPPHARPGTASVATILARPLFSPTRRPPAETEVAPAAPTTIAPPPRLVGTILLPRQRSVALLQGTRDGHQLALHEGDHLGEFTIVRIRPAEIALRRAGQQADEITLQLRAETGPVASSGPATPLPDPRDRAPGAQDE